MVNRLTTSAAHEPDVPLEKYEAFQHLEVCFEPEKIPASPLTLRVKYSNSLLTLHIDMVISLEAH